MSPDKCHNVHQLGTTDALCSSWYRSFLFFLLSITRHWII